MRLPAEDFRFLPALPPRLPEALSTPLFPLLASEWLGEDLLELAPLALEVLSWLLLLVILPECSDSAEPFLEGGVLSRLLLLSRLVTGMFSNEDRCGEEGRELFGEVTILLLAVLLLLEPLLEGTLELRQLDECEL